MSEETKLRDTFVSLRLGHTLVESLDAMAKHLGLTRTAVIERAIRREFRGVRVVCLWSELPKYVTPIARERAKANDAKVECLISGVQNLKSRDGAKPSFVSLRMADDLVAILDRMAEGQGVTRTAVIERAILRDFGGTGFKCRWSQVPKNIAGVSQAFTGIFDPEYVDCFIVEKVDGDA